MYAALSKYIQHIIYLSLFLLQTNKDTCTTIGKSDLHVTLTAEVLTLYQDLLVSCLSTPSCKENKRKQYLI